MKVAIVLGMYAKVERALRGAFPDLVEAGTLALLGQFTRNPGADMSILKSRLCNLARGGAKDILLVLAIFRGREWILATANSIAQSVCNQYPGTTINIVTEHNALEVQQILELVHKFEPTKRLQKPLEPLRQKLTGGKILCVRSSSQTSFKKAFERAGYSVECFDEFFEEFEIDPGKNSNLAALLREKAKTFRILLYAWYGLRHAEVEAHYEVVCKGPYTYDSVRSFARWLSKDTLAQVQKRKVAEPHS